MEKETVGLEKGSIFKPVFEYDGQVRSIHYDSQEGILVANGCSLVLNEAQKTIIDNLILK